MSTNQVEILFICGSPREHSSEALLALLEKGAREAGARSRKFLLSKKRIAYCRGCGSCEKTGTCVLADEGSPKKVADDYLELTEALNYADAVAIVSPLYFAGPPAQLKALFDRLQPYWSRQYSLGQKPLAKRPAQIFILGGGGDSHGYEPLVTISKSALAVAGFTVEKVQNFIGFKYPREIAPLPNEEQAAELPYPELTRLRKETALQQQMAQRAVAAGNAFARFVAKQQLGAEQQAELAEARLAGAGKGVDSIPDDSPADDLQKPGEAPVIEQLEIPLKIIDRTDSDFEALKQAARASKSLKSKRPELDAVIEEAVANMSEPQSEGEAEEADVGTIALDRPTSTDAGQSGRPGAVVPTEEQELPSGSRGEESEPEEAEVGVESEPEEAEVGEDV